MNSCISADPSNVVELNQYPEELRALLDAAVADRDRGLITQGEFDERLGDIEESLGADRQLVQRDLRRGGTLFLVRCRLTGDTIASFAFCRRF